MRQMKSLVRQHSKKKKNDLLYRNFSSPNFEKGKICRNTIGQVSIETLNALYSHVKFAIAVYLKVRWTEIWQIEKA